MRLVRNALAAAALGMLWPASASAFGHKCDGTTTHATTVRVPAVVSTTRTTTPLVVSGGPVVTGTSFITGPSLVSGTSFVTGPSLTLAPSSVSLVPSNVNFGTSGVISGVSFGPPAGLGGTGGTDLSSLASAIQANTAAVQANTTAISTLTTSVNTNNALIAKLVGGPNPAPGPGPNPAPAPGPSPFGPPTGISGTSSIPGGGGGPVVVVQPYQQYEAAAKQYLEQTPPDVIAAEAVYKRSQAQLKMTTEEWGAANKRIADKIKAAGGTVPPG